MLSITSQSVPRDNIETNVADPLFFSYDHTDVIDGQLQKLGVQPPLNGMSGGPAFRLLKAVAPSGGLNVTLVPVGVLCEWHKQRKLIVAAPVVVASQLARSELEAASSKFS